MKAVGTLEMACIVPMLEVLAVAKQRRDSGANFLHQTTKPQDGPTHTKCHWNQPSHFPSRWAGRKLQTM